jgi:cyanophycin synthetase
MKIREIKIMRGPNYWSVRIPKLIVMVLDLQEMEEKPSDKVPGFYDRLKKLIPSLQSHHCSEGHDGGFLERLKDGTWMGHITEHIALEMQTLAGMDVGFGRTRGYGEDGVYNVVFAYEEENVGVYIAKEAVKLCEALISDETYDIKKTIREMREIRDRNRLGPSTGAIVEEAAKRGIPWIKLNKHSLVQLGYGSFQKRIQATMTSETTGIGVDLAGNKEDTKDLLKKINVPTPRGVIIEQLDELKSACEEVGFPLVIKPIGGNHGRGITVNINSFGKAETGFQEARKVSEEIIVEKYISGHDFRLLVIDHKLVAAAKRTPAHIRGDGKSTIKQLIDKENKDPRRGIGHENLLTRISIDPSTKKILKTNKLTLKSVLKKDERLFLKDTANLSTGGTAEDVTDIVHPENVTMAERISRNIDLDICGIDICSSSISKPLVEAKGAVLEVNAGPGFRMHLAPTAGTPRNVAEPVIDKLFPETNKTGEIPIIAITGTNGKTTTTRLISHIAKMKGLRVGYTTSDGVYIQNNLVMTGDCTGPKSSELVLRDPTVNFAVLECARGGLIRSGLAFSKCDVGIVTNVSDDHLGLKGITSVDQLARAKSVVPETVSPEGYAILNADDDRVYAMRENVKGTVALFSMDNDNPRIKELQEDGGITAVYENGYITLYRASRQMRIMKAENIPLTYGGKASFMIENILPAVIAADVQGISITDMKAGLETFVPSASQTPGRLNLYQFNEFQVLMDYAHNRKGMLGLQKFIDNIEASEKTGIIAGIGDRRDEDSFQIGKISAEMFDKIIIRHDQDLRGKTKEHLTAMVKKGIASVKPDLEPMVISSEKEALIYGIENAAKNSLLLLLSDDIDNSTETIKKMKAEEAKGKMVSVK